jgi:hypothetical protein
VLASASAFAFGLAALLPTLVCGEGAVRLLDCSITRVCDAGGSCTAASDDVTFSMQPIESRADGSGRFQLHYGNTDAPMDALSDAGPFVWNVGAERNALLVSSETQFLWHRLTLDPMPTATVSFLRCAIRQ